MTQYVAVKFRPNDQRAYTYHFDGDALYPGDEVKVPDRDGDGWQRVTVASVSFAKPDFATKAIIGKAKPEGILTAANTRAMGMGGNPFDDADDDAQASWERDRF